MGNPFLGVSFHWLGGLASGSFYVPYRGVKKWSWETYWLVGGFFSWIICPWTFALLMTNDVFGVLRHQTASTLWWTYFFGAMWGFGGLTFGLTMRYLGMSLGMGVALGYCAAFGTLVPPIFKQFMPSLPVGSSIQEIASSTPGQVTLSDLVLVRDGKAEEGKLPSRAARLHEAIYRRHPKIQAIVNAVPVNATAFSVTRRPFDSRTIPESYLFLKDVTRVPFGEQYGDGDAIAERLSPGNTVLLIENDGVLVCGTSVLDVFDRLEVLENTAEALINTQTLGEVTPMSDKVIAELVEVFSKK